MKMSESSKEVGSASPFTAPPGGQMREETDAISAAAANLPSTISEEERELAATSSRDFESAKYRDCLAVLNRLSALRPNDNKVKQNKAVAEYLGNGLKFSDAYLNILNQV